VDVSPLTPELRRRLGLGDPRVSGLAVTEVSDESPYRDRLLPGMVILEINRSPVTDLRSARDLLAPGRNLLAVFERGTVRFVVVTVPKP
jgi:serine protease Do/serine protease DegQ